MSILSTTQLVILCMLLLNWLRMRAVCYFCSVGLIVLAGLLCFFALDGCGHRQGSSKLKPCRLPGIGEELLCGKLTVFENRLTHTGRTIDLNVVVLPAFDQKTKAEPLFDLAGGPGARFNQRGRVLCDRRQRIPSQTRHRARRSTWNRKIESVDGGPGKETAPRLSERDVSIGLREEFAANAGTARRSHPIRDVNCDG